MKKRILVIATIMFFGLSANTFAQERPDHEPEMDANELHEKRMEKLTKELNLTPNQVAKLKEIHQKYKPEMDKIKAEAKPIKEKIKTLREKKKSEFEAILTPEQKQKLEQMKKNREDKMRKFKKNAA